MVKSFSTILLLLSCSALLLAGCSGSLPRMVPLEQDLSAEDLEYVRKIQTATQGQTRFRWLFPLYWKREAIGPDRQENRAIGHKAQSFPAPLPAFGFGRERFVLFDTENGKRLLKVTHCWLPFTVAWRRWKDFDEKGKPKPRAWDFALLLKCFGAGTNPKGWYGKILWVPFGPGRKTRAFRPIIEYSSG